MNHLTFQGFLTKYVNGLSYQRTNSLRKLAEECDDRNPRLLAPLVLFAYFNKDAITALRQFVGSSVFETFSAFLRQHPDPGALRDELAHDADCPDSFQKVYRSYLSARDLSGTVNKIKDGYRETFLARQRASGVTSYHVCKDLGLNRSAYCRFLRGDLKTYSMERLGKIHAYLMA
ncbi:MAG: hypothetical protein LBT60_00355 [Oscillospiraceae bacterium]|nr:hypothetical protein [Oscillospiraceae bacterium]